MILVTLGTQDKNFDRLLIAIEKVIKEKKIKEKVIVQAGFTRFKSDYMEIFDLIPVDEFEELMKKCDILITHGGVGSILAGIKNDKKVIAAARLKEHKEHTNNHQKQIIKEFVKEGYILELNDFSKLDEVLDKAKKFKPKKFKSNTKKLMKIVLTYIEEENNISWYNKKEKLLNYGMLSLSAYLFNILIFLLSLKLGLNILVANIISWIITIFISILVRSKYFNKKRQLTKYCLNKLFSVAIDMWGLVIFVHYFSFSYSISKIISGILIIIITFISSYIMVKKEQ